jgi:hypothetical protein
VVCFSVMQVSGVSDAAAGCCSRLVSSSQSLLAVLHLAEAWWLCSYRCPQVLRTSAQQGLVAAQQQCDSAAQSAGCSTQQQHTNWQASKVTGSMWCASLRCL